MFERLVELILALLVVGILLELFRFLLNNSSKVVENPPGIAVSGGFEYVVQAIS